MSYRTLLAGSRTWGKLLLVLLLLSAILLATYSSVVAQSAGGWSQPQMISPQTFSSWFPNIVSDPAGGVHVVWGTGDDNYDLVMYTSKPLGGDWTPPIDIVAGARRLYSVGAATRPALAIGDDGLLRMTYRTDTGTIFYSQVPLGQAASAAAWPDPVRLGTGADVYASQPVIDSHNVIHVLYTENIYDANCPLCYYLFYRKSQDGGTTWSSPEDVSQLVNGVAKPHLLIDGMGCLHSVWESGSGGDMGNVPDPAQTMYSRKCGGESSWTYPIRLGPNDNSQQSRNIVIGQDSHNQLLVVWWAIPSDIVYYQTSRDQGQNWSAPLPIANIFGAWGVYQSRLDDYALAADSAGHLHLIMVGRLAASSTTLSLLHLQWDGTTWSRPDTIAAYQGDAPEWPSLAIANGNQLHVAWFVRDQADLYSSGNSKYRVWYAHSQSGAPAIAAVALPVPTPTITIDASAQVTSTKVESTPVPDHSSWKRPAQMASIEPLKTENDDVALLGLSLVPTCLLLGLFFIIAWRKQRHS